MVHLDQTNLQYHRDRQVRNSTRDSGSARDSGTHGELRRTQRGTQGNSVGNSGTQGTQTTHFGELRRELRGHLPSEIIGNFPTHCTDFRTVPDTQQVVDAGPDGDNAPGAKRILTHAHGQVGYDA